MLTASGATTIISKILDPVFDFLKIPVELVPLIITRPLSYGASIAKGSDFTATVQSPTVVGYTPYRRLGDDYIEAKTVELNYKNIQEDVIINVVYEPALVDFSIHHHLQNLMDDEYSVNYDLITKSKALTGSVVGDGLALTEEQLPGFKPLAYEKLTVAADGSTVIEIRYDRNYYLIDFDMNGGYGTEPIYTRYGASVGANEPTRHGYIFDGWELVSYGGNTPTNEQKSKFSLTSGNTITVPDANLKYRAKWITQQTDYTMVFWKENADNNEYSYWGYLVLNAMSGELVSGQDLISRVSGIDDEQYFEFNSLKTEKNVLVEGDGSTVVNVYYTRKFYSILFKANAKCTIPENHNHNDDCYDYICGMEHIHNENCVSSLSCKSEEHTEHTDECIICGKVTHKHGTADCPCDLTEHTHSTTCWGTKVGNLTTNLNRAPSNPSQGQIYRNSNKYYIYINGSWYRYSGGNVSNGSIVDPSCKLTEHTHGNNCNCNLEEHSHSNSCYRDIIHTHVESCYTYSCGEIEHTHSNECKRLKCGITTGHTHTSNCNNTSRSNTVKTIYRKYQQSISDLWPVEVKENDKIYNSGERWSPSESSYYDAVLVYISEMPPDDFTLTLNEANYSTYTMNYYLQSLPDGESDTTHNGNNYKLENIIKANYNYVTKAEDFFDITGFYQFASNPSFSGTQISISGTNKTVNFYYNRITDHDLEFNNNGIVISDKTVSGTIMYGEKLGKYNFEPDYPSNLEPNAYEFAGWYTSPGCFKGTEVNWDTLTMPVGDLMLYAKWTPITHTVRVFKDANLKEQIGTSQIVGHKAFALQPNGTVSNGNYVFQGWFYLDNVGGTLVEKAFVFNGIPIVKDMDIYAKWSSHVSVNYTINYVLKGTDIKIADSITGTTIAGHNKTFYAKAGDELYYGYRNGYYPVYNSHTVTMSVEDEHVFTFEYVYVESMPYKVQYIDKVTGEKLLEDKIVLDNNLSVVTETFEKLEKKMPDAYQKRLVLSAEGEKKDENGILDTNVITFYYSTDEEHAYYRVVHYIQNISGDDYREYRSEELIGNIGETYTVEAITLSGFVFNKEKASINGVVKPTNSDSVSSKLTIEGMLIELYYDRKTVNYTVSYIDNSTGNDIIPSKTASDLFGAQVLEYAEDLTDYGYSLVSGNLKMLTLSANDEHNYIEFVYQENNVAIKYTIVGPDGCGTLSQYSENITAITGKPSGSKPNIKDGFEFVGWFYDADCRNPVPDTMYDSVNYLLTPVKSGNIWKNTEYFAKIISKVTDLTISVNSTYTSDSDQSYIFHIVGKSGTRTENVDLYISVVGNSSETITQLPTGEYTITELTDWCWRYSNDKATEEIELKYNNGSNSITYSNNRKSDKYLDGYAIKENIF